MRALRPLLLIVLISLLLPASGGADDAEESAAEEREASPAVNPSPVGALVYVPPRRGSPRGRVAGATRSVSALPKPLALAPDHVALTLDAAPSLFWHIDGVPPEDCEIVFTWTEAEATAPLLERELPRPVRTGIQRIDLALLGLQLEPGVEYAWSVTLMRADDARAEQVVSTGYVRRVTDDDVKPRARTASAFAEAGLWYDALEHLSDAIEAGDDGTLREARNSLLRQARLDSATE